MPASLDSTDAMTAAISGNGLQIHLLANTQIQQNLGIRRQLRCEIAELATRSAHRPEHVQRGGQAVTGEQILREDDVAGLLAAEREVAPHHLLHDVLVANGASHDADPGFLERELEADVAHDGGHDRIALEAPFGLHLLGAHEHHCVAINDLTRSVDEDRAVAIAIECHTHRVLTLDDQPRQLLRRGRSATRG